MLHLGTYCIITETKYVTVPLGTKKVLSGFNYAPKKVQYSVPPLMLCSHQIRSRRCDCHEWPICAINASIRVVAWTLYFIHSRKSPNLHLVWTQHLGHNPSDGYCLIKSTVLYFFWHFTGGEKGANNGRHYKITNNRIFRFVEHLIIEFILNMYIN